MMIRFFQLFLTVSVSMFSPIAFCSDSGAMVLGALGSVVTHEAGHALTAKAMGSEILAFRPYPTKLKYVRADGSSYEHWVAGVVKYVPFEGERADGKNAFVAAMGSGGNLLSVFLLAPLIPEMGSDFARSSLDHMLLFSAFDGAAYSLTDLIFQDPANDWSKVSRLSGVPLYWYFLGNLAGGILANKYRAHWHKRAFPEDKTDSDFSVGLAIKY